LPTLSGKDVLDGGGGMDMIRATLGDGTIAPVLKRIESGLFTLGAALPPVFNLAHAERMADITFVENKTSASSASMIIKHASHLNGIAIKSDRGNTFSFESLDSTLAGAFNIAVGGGTKTDVILDTASGKDFAKLHLTVSGKADALFEGTGIEARTVVVDSLGKSGGKGENEAEFNPTDPHSAVRHLVITGSFGLTLYSPTNSFDRLVDYDASAASGTVFARIGGQHLSSVIGGSGTDSIVLDSIGGTSSKHAAVSLGDGYDYLTLTFSGVDATTQRFNGGSDYDAISIDGAAPNLSTAVKNFEELYVKNAIGTYDVEKMGFTNIIVTSATGPASFQHIASGTTFGIDGDITTFLTADVNHADTSHSESLRLLLSFSATLGSAGAGFLAPDLSNLEIVSFSSAHTMYLGTVGSASDGCSVTISHDQKLTLIASNASTSYIDTLTITNTAGVDISGLADGNQAFVSTGATIIGGDGDDVLIGGAGNDQISTGDGDNTVYGSLGSDTITLMLNHGSDKLIFDDFSQSNTASLDTVKNFGALDALDFQALVSSGNFYGEVSGFAAGVAHLSSTISTAFFDTANGILYVDVNHDQQIDNSHDLAIYLQGVVSLTSGQLFF
jgi:S-layer protein